MNNTPTTTKATRNITAFFVLTTLISVPIMILAALTKPLIPAGMPINHIGILMVIAPITAAFILTDRENGREAAKQLLKRAFDHQRITRKIWYVPIVFLLPVIFISMLGLLIRMGVQNPQTPIPVIATPILFLLFVIFSLCEEVGWQGYAFDPMEQRWNALNASIVLGIIGATWHLPLFAIQNPPGGLLWIAGQSINAVVIRILTVWIFNNTGKSVFATILFHAVYNLCTIVLFPIYGSPLAPMIANLFVIITIVIFIYFWGSETLSQFRIRKKEQGYGT